MQSTCAQCSATFEITDEDLAFYEKVSPKFEGKKYQIPPPTFCPDCRLQRRLAFRNEWKLYRRKCDLCGKLTVSTCSSDKPHAVYCQDCWLGDGWDALGYGREFDFSKSFFEQFATLLSEVPKVCLYNIQAENAEHCNFCMGNKDCYLVFGSDKNRDCFYDLWIYECKDTVDSSYCYNSELLYECLDCVRCYHSFYCQDCEGCSRCFLSADLKGCKNCFGCVGLRQKEYVLFNEPVSKEEFEEFMRNFRPISPHIDKFEELKKIIPRKASHTVNAQNFQGDFIVNSTNVFHSFDVRNGQDIRYSNDIFDKAKDCVDCSFSGEIELCYEGYEVHGLDLQFCNRTWPCSSSQYLDNCDNCERCFGCIGLRHKQYCILNKQYTKEEYEELVPKIIDRMQQASEWGEFFPVELSPFAYNETVAQEYFPMTKEEVEAKGLKWKEEKDEVPDVEKIIPAEKLPDSIDDIPDDILNWAIKCEATGRLFRIIKQELDFYRKMKLPVPHFHPDERHRRRMALRNPRKLWDHTCGKCQKGIQTTYSPERPETVYCEECYLKEVY